MKSIAMERKNIIKKFAVFCQKVLFVADSNSLIIGNMPNRLKDSVAMQAAQQNADNAFSIKRNFDSVCCMVRSF